MAVRPRTHRDGAGAGRFEPLVAVALAEAQEEAGRARAEERFDARRMVEDYRRIRLG